MLSDSEQEHIVFDDTIDQSSGSSQIPLSHPGDNEHVLYVDNVLEHIEIAYTDDQSEYKTPALEQFPCDNLVWKQDTVPDDKQNVDNANHGIENAPIGAAYLNDNVVAWAEGKPQVDRLDGDNAIPDNDISAWLPDNQEGNHQVQDQDNEPGDKPSSDKTTQNMNASDEQELFHDDSEGVLKADTAHGDKPPCDIAFRATRTIDKPE